MYAETYRGRSVLAFSATNGMQKPVSRNSMQFSIYRGGIDCSTHISALGFWQTWRIGYSGTLVFFGAMAFPSTKPAIKTIKVPKTPASKVETYGFPTAATA